MKFGGTAATIVSDTATQIVAISPAGTGVVDVTVTTAGGTSATVSADQFSYVPVRDGYQPRAGADGRRHDGDDHGRRALPPPGGEFRRYAGGDDCQRHGHTVVVTSPPGTAGVVDVRVTTAGGTSATTPADVFRYLAPPTVATPASATPSPVTGTTVNLSVLGADVNPGGEASLKYTWVATTLPNSTAPPTFSTIRN